MFYLLVFMVPAAWIAFIVISLLSEKKDNELLTFLVHSRYRLENGETLEYKGKMYNLYTPLKRYRICISYFIMTSVRITYFVHENDKPLMSFLFFLVTLFGGWWGFPWGPVRTIESFVINAGDQESTTVAGILNL